jgi:hypothetical protein
MTILSEPPDACLNPALVFSWEQLLLQFFFINVGIRASLRVSRLILQVLKLTIM